MSKKATRFSILPTPTIKKDELWQSIGLPDNICNIEPVHTSPKVIKKYLQSLQDRHEAHVQEIGLNLSIINKEIEEEIRQKSNALKHELKSLKETGYEFIYNLESIYTEILQFDDSQFEKSKEYCANLLDDGKTKIIEFYTFLKSMEKYRSDKFKEVLKKSYETLQKSTYKLPYEIQLFFEEQILEINQMILTNLRNYKEIEIHLILVLTNEIKLMLYKITQYEEEWKELCKNEIIRRLKEFNLSEQDIIDVLFKDKPIKLIIKLFNEKIEEILQLLIIDTPIIDSGVKEWYERTKMALNNLDSSAKQLINIYQKNAEQLYNNFYIDAESILDRLLTLKIACDAEIEDFHDNILKPEIASIETSVEKEIISLHDLWKHTLKSMVQSIFIKYKFLEDLEIIFKTHENRITELEMLVDKDLEQLSEKNDKSLQNKEEMQLNVVVDTMRKEATEKKLNSVLKKAFSLLDKIKNMFEKHKQDEIKVASKFYDYVQNELQLLNTELQQFISKYSSVNNVCVYDELKDDYATPLFHHLKHCGDQINEIQMWKTKILDNIDNLILTSEEIQQNKASIWVAQKEEKIIKKWENKVKYHSKRYERINANVFEVRLAEINMHKNRFDSHKASVEATLKSLAEEQKQFEADKQEKVNTLLKEVQNTDISEYSGSYEDITAYIDESNALVRVKINEFLENVQQFSQNVNKITKEVSTSNYNFLKSIKLFFEGGNFSSAEAKLYSKKLQQVDKYIKKQVTSVRTKTSSLEKKILGQINLVSIKCIEKTQDAMQVFAFKDVSEEEFVNIQKTIKQDYMQTKLKMKKINDLNMKIAQDVLNGKNFSNIDLVIEGFRNLIRWCNELKYNLEETLNPPKILLVKEIKSSIKIASDKKSIITLDSKKKSKKSISKQSKTSAASRKPQADIYFLFDPAKPEIINAEDDDKFLRNARIQLIFSLNNLKNIAQKFYSTTKLTELELYKLPATYNGFMWESLYKFKYYYLQCLQVWVTDVREFAQLINEIRKFATHYGRTFLQHVHNSKINALEEIHKQYFDELKSIKDGGFMMIKNITDQLKPLHGYPGNSHMLSNLKKQMEEVQEMMTESFQTAIIPAKEYPPEVLEDYVCYLDEARQIVAKLNFEIPNEDYCQKLISQVKDTIFTTNFEDFPISANDLYPAVDFEESNIQNNSLISCAKSKSTDSAKSVLGELMENYVRVFDVELSAKQEEIYDLENDFKEEIIKSKETWKHDTHRVTELYKMKYE